MRAQESLEAHAAARQRRPSMSRECGGAREAGEHLGPGGTGTGEVAGRQGQAQMHALDAPVQRQLDDLDTDQSARIRML